MSTRETIFAPATAPGKSGVAVVRISGRQAASALFQLTGRTNWQANVARFSTFRKAVSGDIIDRGIALYFQAPASFTGEDVAELQVHGSLAVVRELLAALSEMDGLRPAEPGEFSRRAFANGKMDLAQAEGLLDLIKAETLAQKTQALRQMEGEMSAHYDALRTRIIRALAHLEAYIDFPDEDIPDSVFSGIKNEIADIQSIIEAALSDHKRGERVREGIHIVILGAPNAGKSSLLNALAGRDAAIVSHRAGTTRDVIEVHMDMSGYPVILTDTAGLRESGDEIEEEGVRRALERAGEADLKLVLFDGSALPDLDKQSLELSDNQTIQIINKSDIMIYDIKKLGFENKPIVISTKTGEGIDTLIAEIERRITTFFSGESTLITRHRHRAAIEEANEHLKRLDLGAPVELACEELRQAARAVGKITGKVAVDDLLDVIFREFCVGK